MSLHQKGGNMPLSNTNRRSYIVLVDRLCLNELLCYMTAIIFNIITLIGVCLLLLNGG